MTGKTVTRADICEAVYRKVGLSRTESATLVELVLTEITDCLERGETVKLSSFGSFVVRKKGQRIGRNPKTGKEVSTIAEGSRGCCRGGHRGTCGCCGEDIASREHCLLLGLNVIVAHLPYNLAAQ